ncbi:MAG TPA: aminotransferase class V-fold PLP-dependent enzyme [Gemmatimonadales bacterium]|nr:aminotransferase class V-fold PLP-dependent enzyme [Gemmatimonadales bacterium]
MTVSKAAPAHRLARYREEFPIFRRSIYLNSCSLGALSRRSRARVEAYLDLWEERGAPAWYDVWWGALDELRTRYARLIGARPGEIALHSSISSALGVVAGALDYGRRPKVVTTGLDFPTVVYQWLARTGEGIEVAIVPSPDGVRVPLEALARAIDDRTALVATSHVFFTSGAIQDVAAIARLAHRRGAYLLVDGYQAAGQLPVDVAALGVDFYAAGGLKWLLGGSGIAFLYVRDELIPRLVPRTTGWFAHAEQFAFDRERLVFRDDARRFETGTPSLASVYAQLGGLDVLEEIGVPEIRRVAMGLTEDLIETARALGLEPRVAPDPAERSAIVMLPSGDPAGAVRRLAQAGIVADARPGHVRLSPFFYNVPDDHRAALERLARD